MCIPKYSIVGSSKHCHLKNVVFKNEDEETLFLRAGQAVVLKTMFLRLKSFGFISK